VSVCISVCVSGGGVCVRVCVCAFVLLLLLLLQDADANDTIDALFIRNFINRQNAAQASRHAQAHAPEHFSAQLREAFVGRHRE